MKDGQEVKWGISQGLISKELIGHAKEVSLYALEERDTKNFCDGKYQANICILERSF